MRAFLSRAIAAQQVSYQFGTQRHAHWAASGTYVSAYKNLTCASRVPSVTFASSAPIIATAQAPRRHRVGGAIGEGRRRRERQAGREGAGGGDSLL
jgi:hypothetical protein